MRIARRLVPAAALALIALVGISAYGVSTSMTQSYPAPPEVSTPESRPAATQVEPSRLSVAVIVGASGSVATDVLAPFEVFARSGRFSASIVAASAEPVVLSGGVHLMPDRTFAEPDLRPDVVVVPAVTDPAGRREAPLREWVATQAARGALILGVCAGSEVLAASGVLEGRRATSHWSLISHLDRAYAGTEWLRGVRYVEDGQVITTAGVTSGVAGALRVVERLAGSSEAQRVGDAVAYPGWTQDGDDTIPDSRWEWADLPFALNSAYPWFRPTTGLVVSDGVAETDLAAAADLYSGTSFATRTVLIGARSTVTTRHGLVLLTHPSGDNTPRLDRIVAPGASRPADVDLALRRWAADRRLPLMLPGRSAGAFAFDPILRDLARSADVATAVAAAKYAEYPAAQLALTGSAWPWRATALFGITLVGSTLLGGLSPALTAALARRFHDVRHGRSVRPALEPVTSSTAAAPTPDGR